MESWRQETEEWEQASLKDFQEHVAELENDEPS